MIRVFLVDDHPIVRDGIRSLLDREPGLQVVGTAGNGQELLDKLPDTPTDLVLIDVNMPVLDGYATTLRLREEFPDVKVLALSMLVEELYIGRMLDAGASGYLLKSTGKEEIIHAIRTVMDGKQFLCSEIGLAMLHKVLEWSSTGGTRRQRPKKPAALETGNGSAAAHCRRPDQRRNRRPAVYEQAHGGNPPAEHSGKTQAKNTAALVKIALADGLIK
ncbi:response regulator [Hymenobacter humi]